MTNIKTILISILLLVVTSCEKEVIEPTVVYVEVPVPEVRCDCGTVILIISESVSIVTNIGEYRWQKVKIKNNCSGNIWEANLANNDFYIGEEYCRGNSW